MYRLDMKNENAAALGRLGKGKAKNFSEAELKRRALLCKALHEKRKKVEKNIDDIRLS